MIITQFDYTVFGSIINVEIELLAIIFSQFDHKAFDESYLSSDKYFEVLFWMKYIVVV